MITSASWLSCYIDRHRYHHAACLRLRERRARMSRSHKSAGRTNRARSVYGSRSPQQLAPGKQSAAAHTYQPSPATTAFDRATAGMGAQVPYRSAMEQTFAMSFADVQAFTSCHTLRDANAHAAARGDKVAFTAATPSQAVVAHELTHVVQQQQAGVTYEAAQRDVAEASDPAEREAASIAAHVAAYGAASSRASVTATPTARVHLERGTAASQIGIQTTPIFVPGDRITISGTTSLGRGTFQVLVTSDNGSELWGELYAGNTGEGTGRTISAQRSDLTRIVDRFGQLIFSKPAKAAAAYAGTKVTGSAVGGVGEILETVAKFSSHKPTAQWAVGKVALVAGIGEGIYQCLHDALAAIPELIKMTHAATMSHARGTLLQDAVSLIAALTRLSPSDIANLVIPGLGDLSGQLLSRTLNPWQKYRAFGKVLGYLLAEVAIAVISAGATLGAKLPAILARFGKLATLNSVRRATTGLARSPNLKRLGAQFAHSIADQFPASATAGKSTKPPKTATTASTKTGRIGVVAPSTHQSQRTLAIDSRRISDTPKIDQATGTAGAKANATQASVRDKLARYLLNPKHPVGSSKAEWFRRALGFTQKNANDLAKQILFNPKTATQTTVTQHGTKFNQVIPITGANGKTIDVTFAWIRNNDGIVRLVTGIPTK